MRWLKKLLIGLYVAIGALLLIIIIAHTFTGNTYEAECAVLGGIGGIESILGMIIKREEVKIEKASDKDAESEHTDG